MKLTDTQRLEAIEEYGLCLSTHDVLQHSQWTRTWVVTIGGDPNAILAPSIREVIDAAILYARAHNLTRN